jgi:hypothetical protein
MWIIAMIFLVMLFVGYYVMMKPTATIYDIFMSDEDFQGRGREMFPWVRSIWVYAGILMAISMIIWVIVSALKKDYQQFQT